MADPPEVRTSHYWSTSGKCCDLTKLAFSLITKLKQFGTQRLKKREKRKGEKINPPPPKKHGCNKQPKP